MKKPEKSVSESELTVVTLVESIPSTMITNLSDTTVFCVSSSVLCFHHSYCSAAFSSEQVTLQKSKTNADSQATTR